MDIPGLSMAMSQQHLMTNVNVAVMSQSLDLMKDIGNSMTAMMEQSVTPNLGQNIDISV